MIDRQRLSRNALGFALLFAWLFLALSLAFHNAADPPGASAEPANDPPKNLCGPVGAALSFALYNVVGWGAFVLLWGLIVVNLLAFRRRAVAEPGLRLLGLGLLTLVTSVAAHELALPGQPVGGGGYVGAIATAFLGGQFGPGGLILIVSACAIIGFVLAYEVLFVWPIRELMRLSRTRRAVSHQVMPTHLPAPALALAEGTFGSRQQVASIANRNVPAGSFGNGPLRPAPMPVGTTPARLASPVAAVVPYDGPFELPPANLLEPSQPFAVQEHESMIAQRAMLLEKTLREHGCIVRVVQIDTGPVITQFEIELEAGLRVSKISGLSTDLAIALAVPSVRIVSPIPGKTTVGIEVPNERRAMVKLGEVVQGAGDRLGKFRIPLFLGKDVKGAPLAFDLAEMPHLLIAGRTGTGKSVCLNAMIMSILMTKRPDEVKLLLIDPKMVELSQFKRIPHLMHPVVTDMKKAESLLSWACDKMDERYTFLQRAGVRNIQSYNALGEDEILNRLRPEDDEERARIPTYMPYIVIIADEMADLMMTAAKEVEQHIVRLAQKARAVGMHLIVATQKPTVDVITGLIKGNLPARIAFQVSNRSDSRVVLDEMGADKLLGNGDMLFLVPGTSHIMRAQGTYVSDAEINGVCHYLERYPVEFSKELVQLQVGGGPLGKDRGAGLKERDELYEPAIEVVIREGRGSCSLLQRALGIGYGRAARLIDFMAEDGIVGEFKSGSAREVLYSWDEWEAMKNGGDSAESAA
jgi:S-DNA-T family DNA segregation ATPase FtsK/SpoIIIE